MKCPLCGHAKTYKYCLMPNIHQRYLPRLPSNVLGERALTASIIAVVLTLNKLDKCHKPAAKAAVDLGLVGHVVSIYLSHNNLMHYLNSLKKSTLATFQCYLRLMKRPIAAPQRISNCFQNNCC